MKPDSTPVSRTDDAGNTYQLRMLRDGTTWEILKNFPAEEELRYSLDGMAVNLCWTELDYYWLVSCQVPA